MTAIDANTGTTTETSGDLTIDSAGSENGNETMTTATSAIAPGKPRPSFGRLVEKYAILIAWVAVIAVFWVWKPDTFGTMTNLQNILGSQSALLVLTLGLLISLSAGEFDLSIGASFSLGASVLVWLDVDHG
jgi:ribose transport system permease protein